VFVDCRVWFDQPHFRGTVMLVLLVGTMRLVGSNANNAFSAAASAIQ
jgi:hypothetical protein